jgi:GT2 family glycosyltransferase
MSADVSLVLVTFRSSAVAPAAVASFREGVLDLGVSGEVVIVDHSEDEGEQAKLRALAPDRLLARPNRGYAAGVNAGVAAAGGPTILVGNPDITFAAETVGALMGALDEGWDVVGPQFVLAGLLFPPADLQTPGEQFNRWLASRSRSFWDRQLRRELARWRAVWDATGPVPVPTLSGALLAFRRETFERVAPWDEGYFLYFEETDWLRRASRAGLRLAQVPRARVEHLWGHVADPLATGAHFAYARRRFLLTHYGWRGRLASRLVCTHMPLRPSSLPDDPGALPPGVRWWLLSPTALGVPAAGFSGLATDFLASLNALASTQRRPARYVVFTADPDGGDVAGPWWWEARRG